MVNVDGDLRQLHRMALLGAGTYVRELTSTDLDRRTPCTEWSLADLLGHMIGQHEGFATAVRDGAISSLLIQDPSGREAMSHSRR